MAELRPLAEGIVLTHFIVSDDVQRSRRFYTDVLGGKVVFSGGPTCVALANSWIVINVGGGPTDDKPAVTLETPRDLDGSPAHGSPTPFTAGIRLAPLDPPVPEGAGGDDESVEVDQSHAVR